MSETMNADEVASARMMPCAPDRLLELQKLCTHLSASGALGVIHLPGGLAFCKGCTKAWAQIETPVELPLQPAQAQSDLALALGVIARQSELLAAIAAQALLSQGIAAAQAPLNRCYSTNEYEQLLRKFADALAKVP